MIKNFLANCLFFNLTLFFQRVNLRVSYVIGIPDHNNNNEADNRWIKEDQGRKRLGLISFFSHAETTLVRDWSLKRRPESYLHVPFQTHPTMEL